MNNIIRAYLYLDKDFSEYRLLEKMISIIIGSDFELKPNKDFYEIGDMKQSDFMKVVVSINTLKSDLEINKMEFKVVPYYDERLLNYFKNNGMSVEYLHDVVAEDYNHVGFNLFIENFKKIPSDILETVKNYINLNCSVHDVSELMFTHRNTINYRINRFVQLSGIDIRVTRNMVLVDTLLKEMKV